MKQIEFYGIPLEGFITHPKKNIYKHTTLKIKGFEVNRSNVICAYDSRRCPIIDGKLYKIKALSNCGRILVMNTKEA